MKIEKVIIIIPTNDFGEALTIRLKMNSAIVGNNK